MKRSHIKIQVIERKAGNGRKKTHSHPSLIYKSPFQVILLTTIAEIHVESAKHSIKANVKQHTQWGQKLNIEEKAHISEGNNYFKIKNLQEISLQSIREIQQASLLRFHTSVKSLIQSTKTKAN